jgi:Na+-transporting NADH:ubiquinone oxidoreductase subunit NqrB
MKETLKTFGKIAMWIAIAVITFLIFSNIGSKTAEVVLKEPLTKEEVKTAITSETNIYSEVQNDEFFKKNFMNGCKEEVKGMISNTKAQNYCECTYSYLVKEIKKEGLITMSVNMLTESLTENEIDIMTDAVLACQKFIY